MKQVVLGGMRCRAVGIGLAVTYSVLAVRADAQSGVAATAAEPAPRSEPTPTVAEPPPVAFPAEQAGVPAEPSASVPPPAPVQPSPAFQAGKPPNPAPSTDLSRNLREQPAPAISPAANRAGIGLLVAGGMHTGLALGTRLGIGDLGVELTGGYQLLLAVWHPPGRSERGTVDLGSSAQFGGELYFTPWHPTERSAIGLKSGYRYNTVLEHGFAVAITFLGTLGPDLAVEGLAGTQVFPGSRGRLLRALGMPSDADITYASNAQYFEYGLQLIWYP